MKALTIKQPWAELIFREMDLPFGTFKQIETRSWKTGYRGKLAIHAAKKHDTGLLDHLDDDSRMTFASAGIYTEQDIDDMVHANSIPEMAKLLAEYAGIETHTYIACQYFCGGSFVGDNDNYTLDEVLKNAFVEVEE